MTWRTLFLDLRTGLFIPRGELLRQIAPATNRHDVSTRGVGSPSKGRFKAGRDAGLSRDEVKTAMRVARIPEPEFEAAIESDDPPTVTRLLEDRKPQGSRS